MTIILLLVLLGICFSMLGWGILEPQRMYQFPFLAGAVFLGWVLPQLIGLASVTTIPDGALDKTILMSIFCALACYFGYIIPKKPLNIVFWSFNRKRLIKASALLSILGSYFFYLISQLAETANSSGQGWTGIITIYVFFATMLTIGFAICLICHLHRPTVWTYSILIFDLIFYFDRIVLQGRRQAMVELFVIVIISLWFSKGKIFPRWVIIFSIITGTLLVNGIGDYREAVLGENTSGFSDVLRIDFIENFKILLTEGGIEMMNAVYNIEAIDQRKNFDYGLSLWNELVIAYIPAQFFGDSFKQGLLIELDRAAYLVFSRNSNDGGSTQSGMSDSFASFWYLGFIKFFIIAFILDKLHKAGNTGHIAAQLLLMLVFVGALESITHGTDRFFLSWPRLIMFLMPALLYAREKSVIFYK